MMPNSKQRVPKYSFPHFEVYVNDNSIRDNSGDLNDNSDQIMSYTCVFRSEKGIDNRLIDINSKKELYKLYGKSNHKKYGQPFMIADSLIKQGNVKLKCMRLMPDDAFYANDVLSAWIKEDKENKKFYVKFTHKSLEKNEEITNFKEIKDDMKKRALTLDGTPDEDGNYVDEEGFKQYPIILFSSNGRGTYGNNLRWRITPNADLERAYGFKSYTFQCLNVENGTEVDATYTGSLVTTSKITKASFINDVIEDSDEYKIPMDIFVFEDVIEEIYDRYVEFWKSVEAEDPTYKIDSKVYTDTIPSLDRFDLLFGTDVAKIKERVTKSLPFITYMEEYTADVTEAETITIYRENVTNPTYYFTNDGTYYTLPDNTPDIVENITLEELATKITNGDVTQDTMPNPDFDGSGYTKTKNIVLVNDISGNELLGGDEGSFPNQEAINDMYIKAFSGSIDRLILSVRRVPAEAWFDANFDMPVKVALARLVLYRNDAMLYLDTGLLDTISDADIRLLENDFKEINNLAEEFEIFTDYLISYNLHYYRVLEESTGKRVPVTITNFLASIHPTHFKNYGYYEPMTGYRASLSGHIKNSLMPSIEYHENDLKQMLFDSRFNYFEAVGENEFQRATQTTSYIPENGDTSDLLEESNVYTAMILKRLIEKDLQTEINGKTDEEQRSLFRDIIKEKYKYMKKDRLQNFDVHYEQNEFEYDRDITHMYLDIEFPKRNKIIITEININRSSFDDEN